MKVTFFQRKPYDFHFSIEKLFDTIIEHFSPEISHTTFTLPYYSIGVISRVKSGLVARKNQGTINHITGDIHFITPFLSKEKTINTYHDFTFLKNSRGIKRALLKYFWVTLPVKKSAMITVISEVTRQKLVELTHCPTEKIRVIPNIISAQYTPHQKEFNTSKPIILHIGTTPNKNLNRLITAIQNIPCRLHIIGKLTPEQLTSLQRSQVEYENRYQLSDEELKKEYINCDMVSFCSLNEGFGLPILEAQATGRPVITSNISSMPEVAGEGACFVDPYNVSDIRRGIQKVIDDHAFRENLITKGLENAKRFNPKVIAGMYEKLYEEITNLNLTASQTCQR
ncbi:glycosyltransferase family 4 protein [Labilibacter sediminis]|nr:glycosyltransferase family 4 protein [Labilibacter sediminis]